MLSSFPSLLCFRCPALSTTTTNSTYSTGTYLLDSEATSHGVEQSCFPVLVRALAQARSPAITVSSMVMRRNGEGPQHLSRAMELSSCFPFDSSSPCSSLAALLSWVFPVFFSTQSTPP